MMHMFNTKTAVLALTVLQSAYAHTGFSNFFVDGVDQGDAICVRMNPNPSKWNSPIESLGSSDMACGFGGTKGVGRTCEVPDGATLTFEWREVANDASKGVIDPSHMGPCAVYMKKVDSAVDDGAAGDGWFKLWDQGYDESSAKKWCTLNLIDSKGLLTINLPKGLVGGDYLVRPEALALHNANQGDPQYYTGCAQIFLTSSGSLQPESTVSIPGYVSVNDPADSFNIWKQPMDLPYPIPGPSVANLTSSGHTTQISQADGKKPDGCILESGSNWCGFEVPDYSDQTGCWAAAQNCWDQHQKCWDNAPPTGGNCPIWTQKCTDLDNQCTAKNFMGPPNKGKDLTPPKSTISPPKPLGPTVGGNTVAGPTAASAASAPASASAAASSSHSYGNYSMPTSVQKVPSVTPVAPVNTKPAPSTTDIKPVPATSTPYEEEEEASTPAGAVPTSVAPDMCYQETVTVTATGVTTVTLYPSSGVDVKPVLTSTGNSSSTKAKPTAAGKHAHDDGRHNSTFSGYSTGMAYPSGFTKLPKTW